MERGNSKLVAKKTRPVVYLFAQLVKPSNQCLDLITGDITLGTEVTYPANVTLPHLVFEGLESVARLAGSHSTQRCKNIRFGNARI